MIVDLQQRSLQPRVVQVVLFPIIQVRNSPSAQIKIDDTREKKGEACQNRANLNCPLSQRAKLTHPVKRAASATRGSTYQRGARTGTPSQSSLTRVVRLAVVVVGGITMPPYRPIIIVWQVQMMVLLWNRLASHSARYIAACQYGPDRAVRDTRR